MRLLESLAKLCAIAAGLLLTAITLMTCVSLIGRNLLGAHDRGDFELVGRGGRRRRGALPAVVPGPARQHHRRLLHRPGERPDAGARSTASARCCSPSMLGLMAWRTAIGGLNAWRSNSGTMMIGFPEWVIYGVMLPPLVLCAVIGVAQVLHGSRPRTTRDRRVPGAARAARWSRA